MFSNFLSRYSQCKGTDRSNLQRDYLPHVIAFERAEIKCEINDRPISVFFDETQIVWINFCAVVRFVDDAGDIQERLVRLAQYKDSPNEKLGKVNCLDLNLL